MYDSIVAQIYYFSEGGFWVLSVEGYENRKSYDDPDNLYSEDFKGTQQEAEQWLLNEAENYLEQTRTYVVCLVEGNELKVIK